MIDQAAGSRDDDVGPGFKFFGLFAEPHTTIEQSHLEAGVLAVFLK